MADSNDETANAPPKPAETPGAKRAYATLDLKASEVVSKDKPATAQAKSQAAASSAARAAGRAELKTGAEQAKPDQQKFAARIGATIKSLGTGGRSNPFLSHLAAGAAGALVVFIAGSLVSTGRAPQSVLVRDLDKRVVDMEGALGVRPGDTISLRGRVEGIGRTVGALTDTQAKLANDTKSLEARLKDGGGVPPDILARLAKAEENIAFWSTAPPATNGTDAGEATRSFMARFDRELAAIRSEAARATQGVETLSSDTTLRLKAAARSSDVAALTARLVVLEQELQEFLKSDADRTANASRVVLSLELGNLKRAMDRGEGYVAELAAVKKAANATLNLAPLERYARDGVAPAADLIKSFRKAANAMVDAEAEPPGATLFDRLITGARSIVRVRKAGHSPEDSSAEAIAARMEAALKDGHLTEVIAEGRKLPPKAALAAEDWLKQVEARQTVDQALLAIEAAIKTSLAGTEPQR
jgi:hypothetical protein